jgi:hypothetical protein
VTRARVEYEVELGIAPRQLEEELPRPFMKYLARGLQPIRLALGFDRSAELTHS